MCQSGRLQLQQFKGLVQVGVVLSILNGMALCLAYEIVNQEIFPLKDGVPSIKDNEIVQGKSAVPKEQIFQAPQPNNFSKMDIVSKSADEEQAYVSTSTPILEEIKTTDETLTEIRAEAGNEVFKEEQGSSIDPELLENRQEMDPPKMELTLDSSKKVDNEEPLTKESRSEPTSDKESVVGVYDRNTTVQSEDNLSEKDIISPTTRNDLIENTTISTVKPSLVDVPKNSSTTTHSIPSTVPELTHSNTTALPWYTNLLPIFPTIWNFTRAPNGRNQTQSSFGMGIFLMPWNFTSLLPRQQSNEKGGRPGWFRPMYINDTVNVVRKPFQTVYNATMVPLNGTFFKRNNVAYKYNNSRSSNEGLHFFIPMQLASIGVQQQGGQQQQKPTLQTPAQPWYRTSGGGTGVSDFSQPPLLIAEKPSDTDYMDFRMPSKEVDTRKTSVTLELDIPNSIIQFAKTIMGAFTSLG